MCECLILVYFMNLYDNIKFNVFWKDKYNYKYLKKNVCILCFLFINMKYLNLEDYVWKLI